MEEGALGAPGAGPPGAGRGTLDESVWATLRRDAGLVAGNVRAVVLPFGGAARRGECQAVLRNWDLWGPLVFTLVLALTLTEDGGIFLNGEPTSRPDLIQYLPEVAKSDDQAQALIAADKAVPHGKVIEIIDLVRQMGIYRFALNIDPNTPPIKMGSP